MWIYPCVTLVGQGGRGRGGARGLVLLFVCSVVHNIKQKDKRLELDPHAKQTGHSARDDTVSVVRASPRDLRGDEVAFFGAGLGSGNEGDIPSCAAGVRVKAGASMLTAPPPIKGLMMPPRSLASSLARR